MGLRINLKPPRWVRRLRVTLRPADIALGVRIATGRASPVDLAAKAADLARIDEDTARNGAGFLLPAGGRQEGGSMITSILQIVAIVVALLMALVQAVEFPGNGAEKQAQVVGEFKLLVQQLTIPAWAKLLFSHDAVARTLVNLMVWAANRSGWIKSRDDTPVNPPAPGIETATQEPSPGGGKT
jgi:hypothetical protein